MKSDKETEGIYTGLHDLLRNTKIGLSWKATGKEQNK
jgi:hypothetical protein